LDKHTGVKISIRELNVLYGTFHAVKRVTLDIDDRAITAIIGPSGCGKTTFLRALNRMNDLVEGARTSGEVFLDATNVYSPALDLTVLRKRVGMVFQRPNPFPLSVFENVAYGPRIHGMASGEELEEVVERSLRATGLWDELKDTLDGPALSVSPEQQQRLCISRLVAVEPEVLLMDEPCSTLDPIAMGKIEELITHLKDKYCVVIVTHNMQQAARISDKTGLMFLGELVEFGTTGQLFTAPRDKRTEDYVTGRYG